MGVYVCACVLCNRYSQTSVTFLECFELILLCLVMCPRTPTNASLPITFHICLTSRSLKYIIMCYQMDNRYYCQYRAAVGNFDIELQGVNIKHTFYCHPVNTLVSQCLYVGHLLSRSFL